MRLFGMLAMRASFYCSSDNVCDNGVNSFADECVRQIG